MDSKKYLIRFQLSVALLGFLAWCQDAFPQQTFPSIGTALTPANFGRHSDRDIDNMFHAGKEIGDIAVFIYQWSQPDFFNVASNVIRRSAVAELTPIIGLSPTQLKGMRGDYDLPERVRKKAGRNPSFADKKVYEPFMADALSLARLKPPYLCLATEINLLALKDIKQYIFFAKIYKTVYGEIKKVSPSTKVFVSFQWDFLHAMDTKEPDKIKEHSKLIDIFRPELDVLAFTSYPAISYKNPADIPADYYERIYDHIRRSDPVMFMEIGWPSSGKAGEKNQLDFIHALPKLMASVKPSILAWSLLHDVGNSALEGDLGNTGLITQDGHRKSGHAAFKELRQK